MKNQLESTELNLQKKCFHGNLQTYNINMHKFFQ